MITAVCIYDKKDEIFLKEMLLTIPLGWEVVLAETIPSDIKDWEIEFVEKKGLAKYYKIYYPKDRFHFATARNIAKSVARGTWIFTIDADERLGTPYNELFTTIEDTPQDVWGFMTTVSGIHNIENGTPQQYGNWQMRLFRNRAEMEYELPVHEGVDHRIAQYNKKATFSDIHIIHVGYIATKQALIEKAYRNITLMLNNIDEFIGHEERLFKTLKTEYFKIFRLENSNGSNNIKSACRNSE